MGKSLKRKTQSVINQSVSKTRIEDVTNQTKLHRDRCIYHIWQLYPSKARWALGFLGEKKAQKEVK